MPLSWQCWLCGRWQTDVNPHFVTIDTPLMAIWPPGPPPEREPLEVWLCGDCLAKSKPPGEGH